MSHTIGVDINKLKSPPHHLFKMWRNIFILRKKHETIIIFMFGRGIIIIAQSIKIIARGGPVLFRHPVYSKLFPQDNKYLNLNFFRNHC